MTNEGYKTIANRVFDEIFNQGKIDVADEIFAPDFVSHLDDPLPNQPLTTPEAVKWYVTHTRHAFPDLEIEVDTSIVEGNMMATRSTWRGTQENMFLYVPASGRRVEVAGIDMLRLADGKIAEHWGGWNVASVLRQLRALPGPEGSLD